MEPLDLLWELESQWNLFDSYTKELVDLNDDSGVKAIERKVNALRRRLRKSETKKEKIKEELLELEKELKINNFNIEELEKALYDGHTTDVKQLEYLNREKDKIQKLIDKMEFETLEFMGVLEETDEEIKIMEKDLQSMEEEGSEIEAKHGSVVQALDTKLSSIEKKIKEFEKKIDDKLITEYNRIRKSRKSGIVELKDSICMGCNIMIPTFTMEKIKGTKEIFHCESCGRMLYHKELI